MRAAAVHRCQGVRQRGDETIRRRRSESPVQASRCIVPPGGEELDGVEIPQQAFMTTRPAHRVHDLTVRPDCKETMRRRPLERVFYRAVLLCRSRGSGGRIQSETCAGSTARSTAWRSSLRTVSRSTASRKHVVNAATVASAS